MNSISNSLVDYWQRLPAAPPQARRRCLADTVQRVRRADLPAASLVPYALCDVDDDIVIAATATFVGASDGVTPRSGPVDDALEWIRRGLALNRGAVFAALLSIGDPSVNLRLAAYRLTLSAEEVAAVCRHAGKDRRRATTEFLRGWIELLGTHDEHPAADAISAALMGAVAQGR
jgi:hypothetical protein